MDASFIASLRRRSRDLAIFVAVEARSNFPFLQEGRDVGRPPELEKTTRMQETHASSVRSLQRGLKFYD